MRAATNLKHNATLQTAGSCREIQTQVNLSRLDQQGDLDHEKHTALGRNGERYVPNKTYSLMMGIAGPLFGAFWVARAIKMTESLEETQFSLVSFVFPCVGAVIAFAFCCRAYSDFLKAGRYQKAKKEYWQERDVLVAQQGMF